jgi:Na+-transporting methylmalonyl-CoA/oxaloacetate decarboxylase gamma subunit
VNTGLVIVSSLGGIIAFLGLVALIIRGIFKIVNATEDNTTATRELSATMIKIVEKQNDHETRIAILEDRRHRGNP